LPYPRCVHITDDIHPLTNLAHVMRAMGHQRKRSPVERGAQSSIARANRAMCSEEARSRATGSTHSTPETAATCPDPGHSIRSAPSLAMPAVSPSGETRRWLSCAARFADRGQRLEDRRPGFGYRPMHLLEPLVQYHRISAANGFDRHPRAHPHSQIPAVNQAGDGDSAPAGLVARRPGAHR
jgi:hypothetical protein